MSLTELTTEIVERLANGEFLFTYDSRDNSVSVEKDINSLTSLTCSRKTKLFVYLMQSIMT